MAPRNLPTSPVNVSVERDHDASPPDASATLTGRTIEPLAHGHLSRAIGENCSNSQCRQACRGARRGDVILTEGDVWILGLDNRSLVLSEDHVGGKSPLWSIWVLLCTLASYSFGSSWFGVLRHACEQGLKLVELGEWGGWLCMQCACSVCAW